METESKKLQWMQSQILDVQLELLMNFNISPLDWKPCSNHRIIDYRMEKYGSIFVLISK